MKKILPILIILTIIFNINFPVMAATNINEKITINQSTNAFLIADTTHDNLVIEMFSPNEHNLDLLIGIILSVVPGFGVGNFWLGNQDEGWLFLKLDLLMLVIPITIAIFSTIFSNLGLIKTDNMNNTNVFNILGIVAWASALGIKIWETASVWSFVDEKRKKDTSDHKIGFSNDKFEFKLVSF